MQYKEAVLSGNPAKESTGSPGLRNPDQASMLQGLVKSWTEVICNIGLEKFASFIRPSAEGTVAPPIVFPKDVTKSELDFARTLEDAWWQSHDGHWRMPLKGVIAEAYFEMKGAVPTPTVFTRIKVDREEWLQRDV